MPDASNNLPITVAGFTFTRTLSITNTGTSRYTVVIKVTPSDDATKVDSVVFDRSRPATATYMCTNC